MHSTFIMYCNLFMFVCLLTSQWSFSEAAVPEKNIHDKMYFDLDSNNFTPCVRRFNGTHQFGCSSAIDGNVGVLHFASSESDTDWLINNSTRGPYVVVVTIDLFRRDILIALNKSSNVNGIILQYTSTKPRPNIFSQEDSCPNRYTTINPDTMEPACTDKYPWNPYGTNIMNENWVFPIVLIQQDEVIETMYNCFKDNNLPLSVQNDMWHPLCGIEMQMGMSGTTNTEVCLRRSRTYYENQVVKQCDPLGGRSILYTANKISTDEPTKNNSIIILSSRLDSKSMFDGIVPGGISTVTSITTLLTTAHILSKQLKELNTISTNINKKPTNNIVFLLLDGEAYDYIGSSKVLYDIENNDFPKPSISIKEQHLKLFLELSQITKDKTLSLNFVKPSSNNNDKSLIDFMRDFKTEALQNNLNIETKNIITPLAPSSMIQFQSVMKNLSGGLITSFSDDGINHNKYYHSIFDDEKNVDYTFYNKSKVPDDSIQATIQDLSMTLATSLLLRMYNDDITVPTVTIDEYLVDDMLHCYLVSQNCSLLNSESTKPSYFVGIKDYKKYIATATGILLANLTGTLSNKTKEECVAETKRAYESTKDNENYYWVTTNSLDGSGYCNINLVNFTAAVSPAFLIEGYNWSSGKYPSWTESIWNRLGVRMFLQPSPYYEKTVFLVGVLVLIVSFAVVLSSKKHISDLVDNVVINTNG